MIDYDTKRLVAKVQALEPYEKLLTAAELLRRKMSANLALSLIRAAEAEVTLLAAEDRSKEGTGP